MPLTISTALIKEMNKLDSAYSVHELVEIQLSESSATLRYNIGNESVVWDGATWEPMAIRPGPAKETLDGDLPTVTIEISNAGRAIQGEIEDTENGLVGDSIIIRAVSGQNPADGAFVTLNYEILEIECNPQWCSFKLGCENFYFMRFPRNILKRNVCRYKTFKGNLCGYGGAVASCDRTFDTCISLNNSSAFGGQPGIPGGGFNVST